MICALFGGTFDPCHTGHVALVAHLLDRGYAERVRVVPAGRSPDRPPPRAAGRHRLAMVRAAFAGMSAVDVDAREVRRRGPSPTVATLAELRAESPSIRWRLVLGADRLETFARWREPRRILDLVETVLVVARGDWRGDLPPLLNEVAIPVASFHHPASASRIRRELAAGRAEVAHLPPAVAAYIAAHGLYGGRARPPTRAQREA